MENYNEISEFIWNIKEHIRDEYAEKDYEEVIQIDEIINFYFTGLLVDWSQNNIMR